MTDSPYPPEWDDHEPDDPRDGIPHSVRPTPAERALVADLVHRYVDPDDYSFPEAFQHFWRDRYTDKRWHSAFLALLEQFATTAVGAQGQALSVARAEGDKQAARDNIIEFGSQS